MFLKLLRQGLGRLVIFISFFVPIKKQKRSLQEQQCIDKETETLSLYQFYACPFCLKTRRAFIRLSLNIKTHNAQTNPARSELLNEGGKIKVPCLRIDKENETIWLYESNEIINYLEQRFDSNSQTCAETIN